MQHLNVSGRRDLKLVSLKTHHISPTREINGVSIVRIRGNIDLFTLHCDVSGRM